jgi:hypothetical protein
MSKILISSAIFSLDINFGSSVNRDVACVTRAMLMQSYIPIYVYVYESVRGSMFILALKSLSICLFSVFPRNTLTEKLLRLITQIYGITRSPTHLKNYLREHRLTLFYRVIDVTLSE